MSKRKKTTRKPKARVYHYHHDGIPDALTCPGCAAELARKLKRKGKKDGIR